MNRNDGMPRDLKKLKVPEVGALAKDSSVVAGYSLLDAGGAAVPAVARYLHHLPARDFAQGSIRTYGQALLRWWRFLAAIEVEWSTAERTDFVDFVIWMRDVASPRHGGRKRKRGEGYDPTTINLTVSALTDFYEFHERTGDGPRISPTTGHSDGILRSNASGKYRYQRRSVGRQKVPKRAPRSIPDDKVDALFLGLGCDRDRALVALWLSTGARASELLNLKGDDVDFSSNQVRVVRKGGATQWLLASPDAMVWLRLYLGPRRLERDASIWQTRRRPFRPLAYDAARRVFSRAQSILGTKYTLHQLRHTAAYRLIQDPAMTMTDVQAILGHAHIGSTELYTEARPEDVIDKMREHHARPRQTAPIAPAAGSYKPESLRVLFGMDL
jgi:site-specific recombinase XerD